MVVPRPAAVRVTALRATWRDGDPRETLKMSASRLAALTGSSDAETVEIPVRPKNTAKPLRPCIGIDPGQDAAGLSLVAPCGRVAASTHAGCWPKRNEPDPLGAAVARVFEQWDPSWTSRPIVCVEVPQNGTHASRGGVRLAEGMILSRLHTALLHCGGLRRADVVRVEPREWRATDGPRPGDREAWKSWALRQANVYVPSRELFVADEAEAVLIGLFGWATQKGGPCDPGTR